MLARKTKFFAILGLATLELLLLALGHRDSEVSVQPTLTISKEVPSATFLATYHDPIYVDSSGSAYAGEVIWESASQPAPQGYVVVESYSNPQPSNGCCVCQPQLVMSFPTQTSQPVATSGNYSAPHIQGSIVYESTPYIAPTFAANEVVYQNSTSQPQPVLYESSQSTSQSWTVVSTSQMPQYVQEHYPSVPYEQPTVIAAQPTYQPPVFVEQGDAYAHSPTANYGESVVVQSSTEYVVDNSQSINSYVESSSTIQPNTFVPNQVSTSYPTEQTVAPDSSVIVHSYYPTESYVVTSPTETIASQTQSVDQQPIVNSNGNTFTYAESPVPQPSFPANSNPSIVHGSTTSTVYYYNESTPAHCQTIQPTCSTNGIVYESVVTSNQPAQQTTFDSPIVETISTTTDTVASPAVGSDPVPTVVVETAAEESEPAADASAVESIPDVPADPIKPEPAPKTDAPNSEDPVQPSPGPATTEPDSIDDLIESMDDEEEASSVGEASPVEDETADAIDELLNDL